jgi:hypothetical protein
VTRAVLTESEFFGDATLHTSAGLDAWLRNRGVNTTRSYTRTEHGHTWIFSQDEDALIGVGVEFLAFVYPDGSHGMASPGGDA